MRHGTCIVLTALLAACATRPAQPPVPALVEESLALVPTRTRGEFVLHANKLDTWNAVGQIVVNVPGVEYQGRSQMMDLYAVRYRGEPFLLLIRGLPLQGDDTTTTTRITAATLQGKPIDTDAAAELLALLQRELTAEIEDVRRRQAAEKRDGRKTKRTSKRK